MAMYIMKASKDPKSDLYVEWSSVVDAPHRWGTSAYIGLDTGRKLRTDKNGTSFHDGAIGGWDDKGIIVHNMGTKHGFYYLKREKLEEFLTQLSSGDYTDPEHQQKVLDECTSGIKDDD